MKGNESSFVDVLMEFEFPSLGRTERAGGAWTNKRGPQFRQSFP
jgi:hypothetical protein